MPPADNMPDFDSMSPDELMLWMESLAKRQGATEGFTTEADQDIPEIDPDSVEIDEPGYVPYGQDPKTYVPPPPPPRPAKPEPKPEAKPEPKPEPVREPEPELPLWQNIAPAEEPADEAALGALVSDNSMAWLESLAADQGGDFPSLDLSGLAGDIEPLEPEPAAAVDPLSWLTNIADSQGEDIDSEEIKVGALAADEDEDDEEEEEAYAVGAELELEGEPGDPFGAGVDPMAWLETLAKRQGVPSEELLTSADLDIPLPRDVFDDSPGYSDYSFDAEPEALSFAVIEEDDEEDEDELVYEPADEFDPSQLEDPAAWLDALAEAQGYEEDAIIIDDEEELDSEAFAPISEAVIIIEDDEELEDEEDELEDLGAPTDDDMKSALRTGEEISPDTMKAWLDAQMDRGFDRTDVTDEILAEDEEDVFDLEEDELVPADLPDWLLDQVGRPADDSVEEARPRPTAELPALFDQIDEAQTMTTADMPDWLRDDTDTASHPDLESIFALTEEEPEAAKVGEEPAAEVEAATPGTTPEPEYVLEVDKEDPWVAAFDEEHDHGMPDITEMPDWYKRNLEDPARKEAVERLERGETVEAAEGEAVELEEAVLASETELPLGELTDVPDWLVALDEGEGEEEPMLAMADLAEIGFENGEMPDWLAEADVELEPEDIPDWLIETMETAEEEALPPAVEEEKISVVTAASVKPITTVMPDTATTVLPAAYVPPAAISPAPVAPAALNIDVAATLERARSTASSGDLDDSLQNYELLIRANAQLEDAVDDLSKLSRQHATNPALFRVLGDGLMRQGKLQQALDTYREALNQL